MANRGSTGAIIAGIAGLVICSGAALYKGQHAAPPVLITNAPAANPTEETPSSPTPVLPVEATPPATGNTRPTGTAPNAPTQEAEIYVHVAGSVKHPGLYHLPAGSRVASAIDAAGGPAQTADPDAVNLAEIVTDGEKIYVPRKGEQPDATDAGNTVGYVSTSAASAEHISSNVKPAKSGDDASHSDKLTNPSEGTVNLNTASAENLERLPGIGPAMAKRILALRQQNGSFHSIDDLREVNGIGDKKLAKIAPFIRL